MIASLSTVFYFLLSNGGERFARHRLLFPGGQDDVHATHAFDGAKKVHSTGKTPPAVAGRFHEMPVLEPAFLMARRSVAAKIAAINLETEQLQPVLEAQNRDIVPIHRELVRASGKAFSQTPQRERVESGDDQLSFRDQDTLDFAQDLMRIVVEFEYMGHDDEIDAVRGEGQFAQVAEDVDLSRFPGQLAQRNAVVREQVVLRQAELERVVTEQIGNQRIYLGLFPGHDVAPLRGTEPVIDHRN